MNAFAENDPDRLSAENVPSSHGPRSLADLCPGLLAGSANLNVRLACSRRPRRVPTWPAAAAGGRGDWSGQHQRGLMCAFPRPSSSLLDVHPGQAASGKTSLLDSYQTIFIKYIDIIIFIKYADINNFKPLHNMWKWNHTTPSRLDSGLDWNGHFVQNSMTIYKYKFRVEDRILKIKSHIHTKICYQNRLKFFKDDSV